MGLFFIVYSSLLMNSADFVYYQAVIDIKMSNHGHCQYNDNICNEYVIRHILSTSRYKDLNVRFKSSFPFLSVCWCS